MGYLEHIWIIYFAFAIVFIDIDECADESLNACNQICNNNDGSFVCECNTGFVLGNDLMTCLGIALYVQS